MPTLHLKPGITVTIFLEPTYNFSIIFMLCIKNITAYVKISYDKSVKSLSFKCFITNFLPLSVVKKFVERWDNIDYTQ